MQTLQARLNRLTGRTAPEPRFDADSVLPGLSPDLVINLAKLAGATLEDLQVTFQLLPWGDRATLAAYDVIKLEGPGAAPNRGLLVLPVAVELVSAAAEVVAAAADPKAIARVLDDIAAAREPAAADAAASAAPAAARPKAAPRPAASENAAEVEAAQDRKAASHR